MSERDRLEKAAYDLAMLQNLHKTDEELRNIVMYNAQKIVAMPQTQSGLLEATKLLGEQKACNELLKDRENNREEIVKAKKQYNESKDGKLLEYVLNLPTAVTPNGQLVAAILEDEDGLTKEDLHNWCEEFEQLSDEEFDSLINGLVAERIISKKDNVYKLQAICGKNLTADNPYTWMIERINSLSYSNEKKSAMRGFAEILYYEQGLVSNGELTDPSCMKGKLKNIADNYKSYDADTKAFYDMRYQERENIISQLVMAGIISSERINGKLLYHYYVLGKQPPAPVKDGKMADLSSSKKIERPNPGSGSANMNAYYMELIYALILQNGGGPFTMPDIEKLIRESEDPEVFSLSNFSGNKISALVRGLRLEGRVNREEIDGRAFFSAVMEEVKS